MRDARVILLCGLITLAAMSMVVVLIVLMFDSRSGIGQILVFGLMAIGISASSILIVEKIRKRNQSGGF